MNPFHETNYQGFHDILETNQTFNFQRIQYDFRFKIPSTVWIIN
jgi:hypothetical protein